MYDNLPAVQEIEAIGNRFENTMAFASTISHDVVGLRQITADLQRDTAAMEFQLANLMDDRRIGLQKFRELVPIVSRQLDRMMDNMERMTDKILDGDFAATDAGTLQARQQLIDVLDNASNNFSNMMINLISK